MSQFHVKLFLVLLKCNTLIKLWLGMENWETCVFFCFSYSPYCYQASGRGRVYDSISATKKSILLPKNSHMSHVRGSITRHISIQQFSEKTRKNQINFICGKFHQSTAPVLRWFFYSFLLFCSEILLTTVYQTSRLVCCIKFHGYLHFGSYFWKHLRHFC